MHNKIIFLLFRLLSTLPLGVVQVLATPVGWLMGRFPNRERRTAEVNVALCLPELSATEQSRLVRRSLVEGARTLLEMPVLWRSDSRDLAGRVTVVEGEELPRRMLERGRGVIIAAPHLGCWEAGVHYLASLSPISVLYRPPRQGVLEQLMNRGRGSGGAQLVPTTPSGVRALYQRLRNNEMVAILPDQQPRHAGSGAGLFAPFFGQPALTMVLVNRLARKTGAAVIFGFAERKGIGGQYHGRFIPAPEGIDDADPAVAVAALNRGVEACVRRCPEQYQWSYRRFSVTPDGSPSIYK